MLKSAGKAKKRIALVCTVWGAKFLEVFCDYSLASLLAPSNLPWAAEAFDITFLIYTREADISQLQAHENVRRLAELVEVKFVSLETLPAAARHGHWVQWQHALLNTAGFWALVLVIPDCVYANSLLQKVLGALATKEIVYYSLPQVCLEPILPRLRRERAETESYCTLDLSEEQIVKLFVQYINPKHAVAIYKPDYFVTHPEYVLAASKGRLELTELACHPLAVNRQSASLSYSFNPTDELPKTAFLEILGVSCEFTLKFIEQYFRWRSDRMDLSRSSNLASWYFTFRERGAIEYARTKTDIALSGLEALSQKRTEVSGRRVVYGNAAALYRSAFFSLYRMAADCEPEIRRFIALAMHLPGFRKAIMGEGAPLTIALPVGDEPVEMLKRLYALRQPETLIKFLLMHVVRGKALLKSGQHFVLDASERPQVSGTKLRVIDPALVSHLKTAVIGKIVSEPVYVAHEIVAYMVRLTYGSFDQFTGGAVAACHA
jgi:hypothetical protein